MPILEMTLLEYFDKEHDEHVYDLFPWQISHSFEPFHQNAEANASSIQDPRNLMQIATGHVNLNNGVLRPKSEAGRVRNHEE